MKQELRILRAKNEILESRYRINRRGAIKAKFRLPLGILRGIT